MRCATKCEICPLAFGLRWVGRLLGLTALLFVTWFYIAHIIAGEGPNPFQMKPIELTQSAVLLLALVGLLIGWRWELIGGILNIAGIACFFAVNWIAFGAFPGGWALPAIALPGLCFLGASLLEACKQRHLQSRRSLPT